MRLVRLGLSQELGVCKATKDNRGLEKEPQGRIGSSFSHHAAMSDAELSETSSGMC
jgi:hypothetical protein